MEKVINGSVYSTRFIKIYSKDKLLDTLEVIDTTTPNYSNSLMYNLLTKIDNINDGLIRSNFLDSYTETKLRNVNALSLIETAILPQMSEGEPTGKFIHRYALTGMNIILLDLSAEVVRVEYLDLSNVKLMHVNFTKDQELLHKKFLILITHDLDETDINISVRVHESSKLPHRNLSDYVLDDTADVYNSKSSLENTGVLIDKRSDGLIGLNKTSYQSNITIKFNLNNLTYGI